MAASILPHANAKRNRVCGSRTKCNATSGKPFDCKYATMARPQSRELRTICITLLYRLLAKANLNRASVVSIAMVRGRASRSKQNS